jgi:hypothetical protein
MKKTIICCLLYQEVKNIDDEPSSCAEEIEKYGYTMPKYFFYSVNGFRIILMILGY